jgi:hypothetical protein
MIYYVASSVIYLIAGRALGDAAVTTLMRRRRVIKGRR